MDRHRQGLLTKPAPHRVQIDASFSQQRPDSVAQAMERQPGADLSFALQLAIALMKVELKPLTVHGVPWVVAAIVTAL